MFCRLLILTFVGFCVGHNTESASTCRSIQTNVLGRNEELKSHSDYGSSNYAEGSSKCWVVQSDFQVRLRVTDFHLQRQNSEGECEDYVKVYDDDRSTDDTRRLGTFCGTESFGTLVSRGRFLTVVFHSNNDGMSDDGFLFLHDTFGEKAYDIGAYWKAGIIFLFLFVFVIVAALVAVCAAYYSQKKLKPKVILVKKIRNKSTAKYDINGQPTSQGHAYPSPLGSSNQVPLEVDYVNENGVVNPENSEPRIPENGNENIETEVVNYETDMDTEHIKKAKPKKQAKGKKGKKKKGSKGDVVQVHPVDAQMNPRASSPIDPEAQGAELPHPPGESGLVSAMASGSKSRPTTASHIRFE